MPFPRGSGGTDLISAQTLAAPAANITFSSIPQTFNHLRLLVIGASSAAAASAQFAVQLNGNAGGNYDTVANGRGNGATSGANQQAATLLENPLNLDMPAANATAGQAGLLALLIPLYTGTTFSKIAKWFGGFQDGVVSATANAEYSMIAVFRLTAAVTSILVKPSTGNFVTGSAAWLYGIT